MLKTRQVALVGADALQFMQLRELPALIADRAARQLIQSWDEDPAGGVVALAFRHQGKLRDLGEAAIDALAPFVDARRADGSLFDLAQLRDWRNVARIQQAALSLHADFLIGRPGLDVPVAMRAEAILAGDPDMVTFCSPFIAAVLQSGKASYVELETVLSTEDAYNLAELLNVDAIQQWRQSQASARKTR